MHKYVFKKERLPTSASSKKYKRSSKATYLFKMIIIQYITHISFIHNLKFKIYII